MIQYFQNLLQLRLHVVLGRTAALVQVQNVCRGPLSAVGTKPTLQHAALSLWRAPDLPQTHVDPFDSVWKTLHTETRRGFIPCLL
jgi:hypothetical protein